MLTFENGQFYIGKTKNFDQRLWQHQHGDFDGVNQKENAIFANMGFKYHILRSAPSGLSDEQKQIWIDNMERMIIHCKAKEVYDELTGEDSNFKNYQPYRKIINEKMVNTNLY